MTDSAPSGTAAECERYRQALEQLRHLVASPGDMGREEIRAEGRRVIEEALNGS